MAPPRRNADWSRDETILLLDLYLRHPEAETRHPEVVALSKILRTLAGPAGPPIAETFRNPVGIAMKLRNLAQQDPTFQRSGRAGLGHGNRLNAEVWSRLSGDPEALAAEVARIRQGVSAGGDAGPAPSRGPPPAFGPLATVRSDGATEVYVMILGGTEPWRAASAALEEGHDILKIGLSNDVGRRVAELNASLPTILGLRWRRHWSSPLPSAGDAYAVEQAVLRSIGERGWSGAGEFVIAPASALIAVLSAELPGDPRDRTTTMVESQERTCGPERP